MLSMIYLVDEWNGVQISSDNYSSHKGASVELVYNEEFSFTDAYGSLDVTLLTPDSKTFTDSIYDVMISEAYAC